MAFNTASDVTLPGAAGGTLPFLMYPQGLTDGDAERPGSQDFPL